MGLMIAAAAWGFAEASLFFLVPDVLLSAIALCDHRKALFACLAAAAGAMVGGVLMYVWGSLSPDAALNIVERVPGISPEMIARVRDELASQGVMAMVFGPLSGTPYKVYDRTERRSAVVVPCDDAARAPAAISSRDGARCARVQNPARVRLVAPRLPDLVCRLGGVLHALFHDDRMMSGSDKQPAGWTAWGERRMGRAGRLSSARAR